MKRIRTYNTEYPFVYKIGQGGLTCPAGDVSAFIVDGVASERVSMPVQIDAEILQPHTSVHTYILTHVH